MRQPRNTPGLGRAIAALAVAIQGLTDEARLGGFTRDRLEWHCKRLSAAQAVLILTAHEPFGAYRSVTAHFVALARMAADRAEGATAFKREAWLALSDAISGLPLDSLAGEGPLDYEPLVAWAVECLQSDSIGSAVNAYRDGLEVNRATADQAFRDALASVLGRSDTVHSGERRASREEQHERYIDAGPQAWDDDSRP